MHASRVHYGVNSFTRTFRKRTFAPFGQPYSPPCTWNAMWPTSFRMSSNFLSLVYFVICSPLIQVVIVGGLPSTRHFIVFQPSIFQIFDQSGTLIGLSPGLIGLEGVALISFS